MTTLSLKSKCFGATRSTSNYSPPSDTVDLSRRPQTTRYISKPRFHVVTAVSQTDKSTASTLPRKQNREDSYRQRLYPGSTGVRSTRQATPEAMLLQQALSKQETPASITQETPTEQAISLQMPVTVGWQFGV